MKKFAGCLAMLLVISMAGTVVPVSAMLTKEEQEYYRKQKEEQQKPSGSAQTPQNITLPSVREMVTDNGVHVEMESLTAKSAVNMAQTETQAMSETEPETETQIISETAPETETQAISETAPETETQAISETAPETETQAMSETAPETETQAASETQPQSETETETQTESEPQPWAAEEAPLVVLDPGHQQSGGDPDQTEPSGPDSQDMKPAGTEGTQGAVSGLMEHELNLTIAQKVKEKLEERGYRVLLTREGGESSLSEAERAQMANEAGADIYIRLHANTDEDDTVRGALTAAPSTENPYLSDIYNSCIKLADDLINEYCETTGLENDGLWITDTLTGSNWSEVPVTMLEMGYMSNPQEDAYMADEANQDTMADGIVNGIEKYFGR